MKKKSRVCVVGSGVTGLVAIRELLEEGHEVQAYEKSDDVIGVWRGVYDSVQLLTSRSATSFRDYPMPEDYPQFPTGQQYRDYIRAFARDTGLLDHIRFSTQVLRATPLAGGSDGWDVLLSDGTTEHFDALVAAHGHLWDPYIPEVEGEFDGPMLHTSQYRNPGDMAGSTVLVVGSGNSACDMVTDAIASGRQALMSMRSPTWFVPQSFFGTPRGDLAFLAQLDPAVALTMNQMMVKTSVGEPRSYGFPQPESDDWAATAPTFSTLVPYWAQRGRVKAVPQVARFEGRSVHFTDGSVQKVDTVIWATGYRAPVPFLADDVLTTIGGIPARKVGGLLSTDADNLYYSGMCSPRGGAPHNYGRGAQTIARMVTARTHTDGPLADTVFADEEPTGRMDWMLMAWKAELDAADARLEAAVRSNATGRR